MRLERICKLAVVCDHGIQRTIFVKLQFKTACIVALDYFIKSTPLHACLITYTHEISIQSIIVHRDPPVIPGRAVHSLELSDIRTTRLDE